MTTLSASILGFALPLPRRCARVKSSSGGRRGIANVSSKPACPRSRSAPVRAVVEVSLSLDLLQSADTSQPPSLVSRQCFGAVRARLISGLVLAQEISSATATNIAVSRALDVISGQLRASQDAKQQLQLLMRFARQLPGLPEDARTWSNRVMGCTSQVAPEAARRYAA